MRCSLGSYMASIGVQLLTFRKILSVHRQWSVNKWSNRRTVNISEERKTHTHTHTHTQRSESLKWRIPGQGSWRVTYQKSQELKKTFKKYSNLARWNLISFVNQECVIGDQTSTAKRRVLLKNLIVLWLVKKFPGFYRHRRQYNETCISLYLV